MSVSFKLQNGDLALNGNSYATVSGPQKLVQDLRCALLTPLGFFEEFPSYGSSLDDETSTAIIGEEDWQIAATRVRAEIGKICTEYQRLQISRNQEDAAVYGRPTITPEETLLALEGVKFVQVEDKLFVTVELQTGSGEFAITIPVG